MIFGYEYTIDLERYPECRSLVNEAIRLIKSGRRPKIAYGPGVTFAIRRKEPCKSLRIRLMVLYGDPNYAVATCIHEAAHAVMMEELGQPNVRISGPDITLDRNGSLVASGAWMQSDPEGEIEMTEELFLRQTARNATGDVAVQKYCGIGETGNDAQDFGDFFFKYYALQQEYNNGSPLEFWKRARAHADVWTDRPETKMRILTKAAEFLHVLYSDSATHVN
jgi:hypothetical protein